MAKIVDADLLALTYMKEALNKGVEKLEFLTPEDVARTILNVANSCEEVAPVIHSHWKEYEDYSGAVYPECAHCGLVWWLDEGTAEDNEMYYCPKCGAIMDEEVDNA